MAVRSILFFIFRLHGGGAERVVSNLSVDLAESHRVTIAIFDDSEPGYAYKGDLVRIKLPYSANTAGNPWWAKAIRLVALVRALRRLKRERGIDVAISFAEQANIINILSGGRARKILSVRTLLSGEIGNNSHGHVLRSLIRALYNRADRIIVPSKVAAQDLVDHFGVKREKLEVIYNYVDEERIGRLAGEAIESPFLRSLFGQPVLLNVGRITRAKGQWLFPVLMSRVRQRHPGWKLVIIGEAEKGSTVKEQLVRLAGEHGLRLYDGTECGDPVPEEWGAAGKWVEEHDLFLLGFRSNPFQFMRHSRVLLFPSVFEGFPNTLLEAMRCGLPVIAADCLSGPREILAPETDLTRQAQKTELTKYGVLAPPLTQPDAYAPIEGFVVTEWEGSLGEVMENGASREGFIQNGYLRVKDFDRKGILEQWVRAFGS